LAVSTAAIVETGLRIEKAAKADSHVGKGQVVCVDADSICTLKVRRINCANVFWGQEIGRVDFGRLKESDFVATATARINVRRSFSEKVHVVPFGVNHVVCLGEEKECECCAEHGIVWSCF
jgi:hypothetical protein